MRHAYTHAYIRGREDEGVVLEREVHERVDGAHLNREMCELVVAHAQRHQPQRPELCMGINAGQ